EISQNAVAGTASTEDLRQAMIHYRALFRDLLGDTPEPGDEHTVPVETAGGEFASGASRSGQVPPPAADYEPSAGRHAAASTPVNGGTAAYGMTQDGMSRDELIREEMARDEIARDDAAAADGADPEERTSGRTGRRS